MRKECLVKILIGNPTKAIHIIASSRTSARTPKGKLLYPRFEIYADTNVVHSEIGAVTVKSTGFTSDEEILIMRELAEYCGTTGASAVKFFQQKITAGCNI